MELAMATSDEISKVRVISGSSSSTFELTVAVQRGAERAQHANQGDSLVEANSRQQGQIIQLRSHLDCLVESLWKLGIVQGFEMVTANFVVGLIHELYG